MRGSLKNSNEGGGGGGGGQHKMWDRQARVKHVLEVGKATLSDNDIWAPILILFACLFGFNLFQASINSVILSSLSIFHIFYCLLNILVPISGFLRFPNFRKSSCPTLNPLNHSQAVHRFIHNIRS